MPSHRFVSRLARRGMRSAAGIIVAVAVTGSHTSEPQTRQPLKPIEKDGKKWEQWRQTVPVSGSIRVGVMADDPGTFDQLEKTLTVFIPQGRKSKLLCLEVSGRDGRYTAAREYDVSGVSQGPVELELPTEYPSELSNYSPGQLAILGRLAPSCDGPPEAFVVGSWQAQQLGQKIVVFLNSRLPTTIVAGSSGSIEDEVRCTQLPEPTTAYNQRCEVPVRWVSAKPTPKDIWVRMRRGSSFTTLPLIIAVP